VFINDVEKMVEALIDNTVNGIIGEVPFVKAQIEKKGMQGRVNLAEIPVTTNLVSAMVLKRMPY
jgi:hypothetical protein